ncbi:hypothetical protein VIGAN_11216300 [Vigna angularis var. angularis]|uniref:Uncharacterized protein n=1 Tax=Vigna angularis var. angularis TaxID=157739 RepID=A0A0S3TCG8_PHAAN|nr:inorganic pyrophosphatase 1-like [Vigna angularis]BAU02608.1 hypothetical protein VIGAN_11216300 [Vigna angularis var. angularis]
MALGTLPIPGCGATAYSIFSLFLSILSPCTLAEPFPCLSIFSISGRLRRAKMGGSVAVVFDFDRTIIDHDSDRWIITGLGLTHLFNQLRQTMPWTSLMDRIMEELHSNGITVDHIAECLKRTPLHPNIVSAIKSAHALGCDLRIISDANMFSIRTILEHHGLLGCFSQINTKDLDLKRPLNRDLEGES